MVKRQREETTKTEFQGIISELFPNSAIVWKDVPQIEEPPDWYLYIDDMRYAVEATTIIDMLKMSPNKKVSVFSVINSLDNFIKKIDKSAKEQGILSGTYVISLYPIPDFVQKRKAITIEFLNYIRETQLLQTAPVKVYSHSRGRKISIKKGNFNKDVVLGGIIVNVKWEGEAQIDLQESVTNLLSSKSWKLRKINIPKILLILDQFPYSDIVDWTTILPNCPERKNFCCICRICPSDKSVILWANSPIWKAISVD